MADADFEKIILTAGKNEPNSEICAERQLDKGETERVCDRAQIKHIFEQYVKKPCRQHRSTMFDFFRSVQAYAWLTLPADILEDYYARRSIEFQNDLDRLFVCSRILGGNMDLDTL